MICAPKKRGTEAWPPPLAPVLGQISRLFQLDAVPEGAAHLPAQYPVCVVDGAEGRKAPGFLPGAFMPCLFQVLLSSFGIYVG